MFQSSLQTKLLKFFFGRNNFFPLMENFCFLRNRILFQKISPVENSQPAPILKPDARKHLAGISREGKSGCNVSFNPN